MDTGSAPRVTLGPLVAPGAVTTRVARPPAHGTGHASPHPAANGTPSTALTGAWSGRRPWNTLTAPATTSVASRSATAHRRQPSVPLRHVTGRQPIADRQQRGISGHAHLFGQRAPGHERA